MYGQQFLFCSIKSSISVLLKACYCLRISKKEIVMYIKNLHEKTFFFYVAQHFCLQHIASLIDNERVNSRLVRWTSVNRTLSSEYSECEVLVLRNFTVNIERTIRNIWIMYKTRGLNIWFWWCENQVLHNSVFLTHSSK